MHVATLTTHRLNKWLPTERPSWCASSGSSNSKPPPPRLRRRLGLRAKYLATHSLCRLSRGCLPKVHRKSASLIMVAWSADWILQLPGLLHMADIHEQVLQDPHAELPALVVQGMEGPTAETNSVLQFAGLRPMEKKKTRSVGLVHECSLPR